MKTLSHFDCIEQLQQKLKETEKYIEEVEKLLQESKNMDEKQTNPCNDEFLQKSIKMKQQALKQLEESTQHLKEETKRSDNFIQMLKLQDSLLADSATHSLLSLAFHSVSEDFTLQNYKLDLENNYISGIIKNEQNNKLVYFLFKQSDNGKKCYLIPIQNNEIPTYFNNLNDYYHIEKPEEQYLVVKDNFESKLCDLLK